MLLAGCSGRCQPVQNTLLRATRAQWRSAGIHPPLFTKVSPGQAMSAAAPFDPLVAAVKVIPPLSGSNYKGQHGKIGVLGGCQEYTGAPYFAAISALKVGADLAYVLCTKDAATVIKSYSPELMVLPVLPHTGAEATSIFEAENVLHSSMSRIREWLPRMSVLVVGPGMGGDPWVVATAARVIAEARALNLPCLVDGSALTHLIAVKPEVVQGYRSCVLTPNIAELGRLAKAVGVELQGPIGTAWQQHAQEIAERFGGPVLISKGEVDLITDGTQTLTCALRSSPRRAGGQGDVLAGTIATFMSWTESWRKQNPDTPLLETADGHQVPHLMLAAYAGSAVTRTAASLAFAGAGRSMLASDMIQCLSKAVDGLQEEQQKASL